MGSRLVAVAAALLLGACGSPTTTTTPPATPASSQAGTPAAQSDPTPAAQPDPTPAAQPDPPSSQALIAEALAAGQIDLGTSLLYRAYALFGSEQLPVEYRGAPSEDAWLFTDAWDALEALPADTREALLPFIVRPDDPRSIHSQAPGAQVPHGPRAALAGLAQVPGQEAVLCGTNGWATLTSPKGFKVWSLCTGDYAEAVRVAFDLLDPIWDAETELMGKPIPDLGTADAGGDASIDFYMVDQWQCVRRSQRCQDLRYKDEEGEFSVAAGLAPAAPPYAGTSGARTASGYVLVDRDFASAGELADTLAHELFHVLQKAHNWEGQRGGPGLYHWTVESSAEWAGWHFAPADRTHANSYFGEFHAPPHVSLNTAASEADRRYRAWVWHLFRQLESGGANFMAQAWEAVEGKKTYEEWDRALDGTYSFATHFRDFAVKNINIELDGDPLKPRYTTLDPELTEPAQVVQTRSLTGSPAGDFPTAWRVEIDPLEASYAKVSFDESVRQITLDLSGLADPANLDADALLRLPGGWQRRELENGETEFCRDVPTADVSQLYLILSNQGFLPADKQIAGEVKIQALAEPCELGDAFGSITWTLSDEITNAPDNISQSEQVTATIRLRAVSGGWEDDGSSYSWTGDRDSRTPGQCQSFTVGSWHGADSFAANEDSSLSFSVGDPGDGAVTAFLDIWVQGELAGHYHQEVYNDLTGRCEVAADYQYNQGGAEWVQSPYCESAGSGLTSKPSADGRVFDFGCSFTDAGSEGESSYRTTITVEGTITILNPGGR